MQDWTVDAARSGRRIGHGQVRSDNAMFLIRVIWGRRECMGTTSPQRTISSLLVGVADASRDLVDVREHP